MSNLLSLCQMARYESSVSDKILVMMLEVLQSPHIHWNVPPLYMMMIANCCGCCSQMFQGSATMVYERRGRAGVSGVGFRNVL